MSRFRELRLSPDGDISRPGDFLVDAQLASKIKPPVTPTSLNPTEPQAQEKSKVESSEKTGFLRFMPRKFVDEEIAESAILSCAETMVMIAGHDKIDQAKLPQNRRKKPTQISSRFKQINMITYGLYRGDYACRMGSKTKVDEPVGITPERATQILELSKPKLSDDELEIAYKKWIKSKTFPKEETLVFQV